MRLKGHLITLKHLQMQWPKKNSESFLKTLRIFQTEVKHDSERLNMTPNFS